MGKKSGYIIILLLPLFLSAMSPTPQEQKTVNAIRANGPIRIDGVLEEKAWKEEAYSDFVQSDPTDGAEPTEKTEVWVAYDEKSLYVAARLHDSQPELITCRLGRRDDFVDSDWFIFAVDPYYDALQ